MGPGSLILLVEAHAGECTQVPVARAPFVIGRLSDCDLRLSDRRVSRRHARIRLDRESWFIEDMGSRHGLTVNGERVQSRRLVVGDRIGFGIEDSYHLTVCDAGSPQGPLLSKVSELSQQTGRTGPLGRLAAVLDIARSMEVSEGVDPVFEAVVEAALKIAGADRAFLLLRDNAGRLQVKVARDSSGGRTEPGELGIPHSVISDALDRRRGLFSMPVGKFADTGEPDPDTTASGPLPGSALCVPILRIRISGSSETSVISPRRDTLGVLYMDTRRRGARMADGNQALLQALAIEISTVLENARLIEEEREKRRLEHEIQMARGIQRALLPTALPAEGWLVAKGHCESSSQLGGDYYDLMQVAPGKWAAVVADVSGKGIAASILASVLQGAFFLGSGMEVPLSRTLGRINRYLCERSVRTRFATVFVLVIDEGGYVRWSNAGHCPAIVVRTSGRLDRLEPNSRPVGLFPDAEFAEDACRLMSGDKLVIYTDGVTDLRSPEGEVFGEARLREAVTAAASLSAVRMLDALLERVREHAGSTPRQDDLTLLALGYERP